MKKLKTYIYALAALAFLAVAAPACQDDVDSPAAGAPEANVKPNTSIADLKKRYWKEDKNYADTIKEYDGERVVIAGRVISSDEDGNIFKSLIIQDETAAMAFSIDSYNLYQNYRVGQEIVLDVTGMYIGKYAGLLQMGRPSWYTNGKTWQVSFMSKIYFQDHAQLNGMPEPAKIDTVVVNSFDQIPNDTEGLIKYQSQVVRFCNVHFEEGGKNTFSVYHTSVNEEQNRTLIDQNGNSRIVRTSGYAKFCAQKLPVGNIDLVGILSFYNDAWQILVMDTDGIYKATERPGAKDKPYTIAEAIEDIKGNVKANNVWVKGYIVGALQPEVESVMSSDDIQWGAPTITNTTLVIAPDADCKDVDKCLLVYLPADSPLRQYGNLRDNAKNLGKEILIKGNLGTYLGTYGLTDNGGKADEFEIEGVTIDTGAIPAGDGTQDSPYNCGQIIAKNPTSTTDAVESGIWVKGYIVGTMPTGGSSTTLSGTVFGVADAANTNLVLGPTADCTDYTKCIGIQLPIAMRDELSLAKVPGNLGKVLEVKGDIMKYCGGPGIKNLTDKVFDGGSVTPPTPSDDTYTLASSVTSGKAYVFVAGGKYNDNFTKNFGYMSTIDVPSGTNTEFKGNAASAMTFTAVDGGYNISTSEGKYLGAKNGYKTFDTTDDSASGRVWTVSIASDGTATITNVSTGKIVYQDPQYGSFGCYTPSEAASTYVLPQLFEFGGQGTTPTPGPVDPEPGPDTPSGDAITITGNQIGADGTIKTPFTVDGYTVTISQAGGATAPASNVYNGTATIRLYADNTISISGAKMAKIIFTINTATGSKRYTTLTPSTGAMSPAQASGDASATWAGSATDVTFTVGHDATLGSDGASKRGQVHVQSITIYPAK